MPEPEYQQEIRSKREFTLDSNEIEAMQLWEEQEQDFINELNLDNEYSKKIVAATTVQQQEEEEVKEEEKFDKDTMREYLQKNMNKQHTLGYDKIATADHNFYTKIAVCTDEIKKSNQGLLDEIIIIRVDNILYNSKEYSETFAQKLTDEEKQLYNHLCETVSSFKKTLYDKLHLTYLS